MTTRMNKSWAEYCDLVTDALEPVVFFDRGNGVDISAIKAMAEVSAAISARRQADALERIAAALCD